MGHKWNFFRAGGVDQVDVRSGADLLALPELDQKLWVALAMPTRDVAIDPVTMDLLDDDKDGRVRIPDILDAVKWIGATWKNPDDVLVSSDSVPLAAVKDPAVAGAARRVLADLGKADAPTISLAQVRDVVAAFAGTKLNGDGVIIPETAEDDDTRQAIEEAIAAVGSVMDRSGKPGLDQAKADAFFADVDAAAAWHAGQGAVASLGERTPAAADALAAVKAKLDDYFARTALAAFDGRAIAGLNGQEAEFAALGAKTLHQGADDIARLPLAKIEPDGALPLRTGLNPAWAGPIATFAELVVVPVVGARERLTAADHGTIAEKLAPFTAWRAAKPTTKAAALSAERLAALATGDARKKIAALIAADAALAGDYAAIASVEKLVRFQRDFGKIVRNFVNFADFYRGKDGAFQAGTLFLDGRAFHLTVPVTDAGKHGALAAMSSAYLAYCDCKRAGATRQIAAALTNGDADNVFVGRNGIFYDRNGDDWDATVAKIVSNPISVREAFYAPYKKLVRLVEDQIGKRAAEAETKSGAKIESAATAIATVDKRSPVGAAAAAAPAAPDAPATPGKKPFDVGIIAVISLAIGAVIGAIGGLVAMVVGMGVWAPLGIGGLLLAISGPSMLLAWMKLRQRNLGPILDANGWAVNMRARVNVAFGRSLTDLAVVPVGAKSLVDPYADKKRPWKAYLAFLIVMLLAASWYSGTIDKLLPQRFQSVEVLGKRAPAYAGSEREKRDLEAEKKKKEEAEKATPPAAPAPTPTPAP